MSTSLALLYGLGGLIHEFSAQASETWGWGYRDPQILPGVREGFLFLRPPRSRLLAPDGVSLASERLLDQFQEPQEFLNRRQGEPGPKHVLNIFTTRHGGPP